MSSAEGKSLHWAMLPLGNAPGTEFSILRCVIPVGEGVPMSKTRLRLPQLWNHWASIKLTNKRMRAQFAYDRLWNGRFPRKTPALGSIGKPADASLTRLVL